MTTSDQFELGKCIGEGAYGEVYELIGHKPPAVIKYMHCGNDERLKNFKNECEALMKIHHVNVVRLYRYTEEGTNVGIVMDYCQKGPLKGVILDPTITYSMKTVLIWGIQLFVAIRHMHQKHNLVHRDIKPDNIFVTHDYKLKIGDVGLVKVVGDGTVTGTFIGTPRYMSPEMKEDGVQRDFYEQMKEADVLNSHRNDVYSLGLVMWEIIERRTIFTNYEGSGVFDRDQLLFDIALQRVTEIESPECQSKIQKIILRCTNFQRTHRPKASEVLDLLKTYKTNEFISSLPFMPREDKSQKELMKPIGFDDRTEGVMVASEERKYEKRFEEHKWWDIKNITRIMRAKLGTLSSDEREKFFKEIPKIVSRLKEETQTFKDARYVIEEILEIEEGKENLREKDIYEIFELFVLRDFHERLGQENFALEYLKSHEEIWISSFLNWRWCAILIDRLKEIKRRKYTTNFYFRCFISQLTDEGWIHTAKHRFVSEDLKSWKPIPGQWVENPRAEIRSYEIENGDNKHEMLHFSHYKQIPLERIIKSFEKQQKSKENIIRLNLRYLIPMEDSEKNNVSFNIESILDQSSAYRRSSDTGSASESESSSDFVFSCIEDKRLRFRTIFDESSEDKRFYGPYSFPHYIFQLRNPPRPICQKNHSGKCQMDGFGKLKNWSDLPKELHIPVCGKITENEVLFLESYMNCIRPDRDLPFHFVEHPFLFLCCQNLLDIPFLILLDHPNNYEDWESIPGLDFEKKIHQIDVGVLREYFQESKLNEKNSMKVYALIKNGDDFGHGWTGIRLIDYQGNPKTQWLNFETVPCSASYNQFTKQEEATISS